MKDLILQFLKSAVALPAEAPESFQVFPYGQVLIEGRKEPAIMDDAAAALVLAHFNTLEHDTVIDYEHQTLTGQKAPAAGWIKALEWRGSEGLWAKAEWTQEAAGYIERKEYRYHSPVVLTRLSDNRVVMLYNVSLTNQPRIKNIAALAAKNIVLPNANTNQKEVIMWEKLKKLLGLADDISEDKTVEVVEALIGKNTDLQKIVDEKPAEVVDEKPAEVVACKEVLEVLKLDATADTQMVVAAIAGLGATDEAARDLSLQVAKLTTEISEMKQSDLVALALKNGQTSPEELDNWGRDLALKSPEQFKKIVLARPKGGVVPVEDLGRAPKGKEGQLDDLQLEINKQTGIDEETWKKYGPQEAAS